MSNLPSVPHGRSPRRLAAGIVLLAAASVAAVVLARRAVAGWLVGAALALAGFPDAVLVVEEVGPGGIALRDLRAGSSGELEVGSLDVRWSAARLGVDPIDALRAQGITLRMDLRSSSAASRRALELPLLALGVPRSVEIEHARVLLETDLGTLPLAFDAKLHESAQGVEGKARLELAAGAAGAANATLDLTLGGTRERLDGMLSVRGAIGATGDLPFALSVRGEAQLRAQGRSLEIYTPECLELHVERLELERVRLRAPFDACIGEPGALALRAELPEQGAPSYRADLTLRAPQLAFALGPVSAPLLLAANAARLALEIERAAGATGPSFALEGSGETLESPGARVKAESWTFRVQGRDGSIASTLAARSLRDVRSPALFAPLALEGALERPDAATPLALRFSLAAAGGRAVVEGSGTVEPESLRVRTKLRLRPLRLGPDALSLAALSPYLAQQLGAASGQLDAAGSATLGTRDSSLKVDLALREAAFSTRGARFSGVNGLVRLQGPDPWVTPADQLLFAARSEIGVPLTDGMVRFRLQPAGVLEIEDASWQMLGGVVRTRGRLDPNTARNELVLQVRGLALEQIARLVPRPGLSASGTLDGVFPLRFSGPDVSVVEGELHSTAQGGRVTYRPEAGASGRLGGMFRALDDFRFERLRITLSGDPRASIRTSLELRGSNPALDAGRPIDLTFRVDAPLARLLGASGAERHALPDAVESRLRDFSEGQAR